MSDSLIIDVAFTPAMVSGHVAHAVIVEALQYAPSLVRAAEEDRVVAWPQEWLDLGERTGSELSLRIACVTNARPIAAGIASDLPSDADLLTFICAGHAGEPCLADTYASGIIIRLLLEELVRPATLTDSAGMAISIVSGYATDRVALESSAKAGTLRASLGDDEFSALLTGACARDSVGAVPRMNFARPNTAGG